MKFSEFRYERPDIAQLQASFQEALDSFRRAGSAALQHEAMKRINELRRRYSTMANLCHIRHTIDTNDEFYKKSKTFSTKRSQSSRGLSTIITARLFPRRSALNWNKCGGNSCLRWPKHS